MKTFILTLVFASCLDGTLNAQPGQIGVYADAAGAQCDIFYGNYGLTWFYIVHTATTGARGVRFSAPAPVCLAEAQWVYDQSPYTITAGDSQNGVTVSYGSCVSSPIHVLSIPYFSVGLGAPPCCLYPVLPDPGAASGQIEVVDCEGATVLAEGLVSTVNGNATCPCGIVPTASTTWGQIKALYR